LRINGDMDGMGVYSTLLRADLIANYIYASCIQIMHFSAEDVDIIIYSSKREFISSVYYVAVTKRTFVGL
jgi:hypothetical protein